MGNEIDKGGVENRPARFPAQQDRLFSVIQALARAPAEIPKRVLMTPDQGEKITVPGEIDILPPGKSQDV